MERFRKAVEARDLDALVDLLAEDVVFESPIVHTPYTGRAVVGPLLRAVARVLRNFHYTHETCDGRTTALVFRAKVGDRDLQGIDLVEAGDGGKVERLTVFVRPLTGTLALADAVRAELSGGKATRG